MGGGKVCLDGWMDGCMFVVGILGVGILGVGILEWFLAGCCAVLCGIGLCVCWEEMGRKWKER